MTHLLALADPVRYALPPAPAVAQKLTSVPPMAAEDLPPASKDEEPLEQLIGEESSGEPQPLGEQILAYKA